MRKLILSFLFIGGLSFIAGAQRTLSDDNAEKRSVKGFHGIDVATGIELVLSKGNEEVVAVSASKPEYREKIITEVTNGILKIHYETKTGAINKSKENKRLKAYVSYISLDKLKITTGAELKIEGKLEAATLEINANTGGIVKGEVETKELTVYQGTGSRVTLSGNATSLVVEGDTGSKFSGEDLSTSNCNAHASTGAQIYITVEKEMSVKASTGGVVKYRGNGGIREIKTNTGGYVSRI